MEETLTKRVYHLKEKSKSVPYIELNKKNKEKMYNRAWSSLTNSIYTPTYKDEKRGTICIVDTKELSKLNDELSTLQPTDNIPVVPTATKVTTIETEKIIDTGFVADQNKVIHQHDHLNYPHMHQTECNRLLSGIDKNRDKRYYFTRHVTPVRVYISYDKGASAYNRRAVDEFDELNGRQLSANCLKNQIGISSKFLKDASEFYFIRETLSFVPVLNEEQIQAFKKKHHQKHDTHAKQHESKIESQSKLDENESVHSKQRKVKTKRHH